MRSIAYCDYSDTIRQMPENYLLAVHRHGAWKMDPDLAADKGLVVALTLSLMEHGNKWSKSPLGAIMGIAPYIDMVIPETK
jgi:hypothetical protein